MKMINGLELKVGKCMREECNAEVQASVWPGDKMPRKLCHACKRIIPCPVIEGSMQTASNYRV